MTGTIVEILEVDGSDGPRALLSVDTTLLDTTQREITKRFVFQKTYTVEEPMKEKSARALAESISGAMKKFSGDLMADIHRGIGNVQDSSRPSGSGCFHQNDPCRGAMLPEREPRRRKTGKR